MGPLSPRSPLSPLSPMSPRSPISLRSLRIIKQNTSSAEWSPSVQGGWGCHAEATHAETEARFNSANSPPVDSPSSPILQEIGNHLLPCFCRTPGSSLASSQQNFSQRSHALFLIGTLEARETKCDFASENPFNLVFKG